ncbi:SoxR reducing system RseC family protein [Cellvibrio sp. pealriver]|uniref:SoxR reducing system RseC family protein n=1 Tax=Cellvibrio sp. pealriver TaxID=1622269 RepID=UPI00066FEF2C|nr:SoxR reducing system RseC family protein [Cellvibrio sp. pealriver]
MILETGRIMAIEPHGVWVETIQKSACGSCKAEKGCGQSLINKWDGHTAYLWVLLEGRNPADYQLGDEIQIGIPEEVVAKGAMLAYMLPLLTLVIATALAHYQFAHEGITTLSGLAGLVIGGLIVRWYSQRTRLDNELQPVLVDDREPLHIYQAVEQH